MNDNYSSLIPLIEKKSLITDPEKFQSLVNVIFHDFESRDYDKMHNEMWESLPYQYELLIKDIGEHLNDKSNLKLLDIGCGTGLASELLLRTKLGKKIAEVHLLDTSAKMLNLARKRSAGWKKQIKTIIGEVDIVSDEYDVIIISSVLHHIPDLATFLNHVSRIQKPGGVLITIHDPNSGSLESDLYINRNKEFQQHRLTIRKKKAALSKRVIGKLKRILKIPNYMDLVNRELLRQNIIKLPLTEIEMWSITDIHVEGLPYSTGKGISKDLLVKDLQQYNLLSFRTYAFFGLLSNNLDDVYKKKETELSLKNDPYGRNSCSAWIKNSA